MAVWILTQMKRWGQLESDVDFDKIAREVYLAAECDKISEELGFATKGTTSANHVIMGKPFDAADPQAYIESFPINSLS